MSSKVASTAAPQRRTISTKVPADAAPAAPAKGSKSGASKGTKAAAKPSKASAGKVPLVDLQDADTAAAPVPSAAKGKKAAAAAAATTAAAAEPKKRKAPASRQPTAPAVTYTAPTVASKTRSATGKAGSASSASGKGKKGAPTARAPRPVAELKTKAAAKPKVKPVYIQAYGDHHVPAKDRSYDQDMFEWWLHETCRMVNTITFTQWKQNKKSFYRSLETQQKTKKRTRQPDVAKTTEKHKARLLAMPKDAFACLDDVWLSNYGFDGSFSAADLKAGCPDPALQPTFAVYSTAVHHGFQPRGIVSEKTKHTTTGPEFLTAVEGDRVYVGIALPYLEKKKSIFSVDPSDRTYLEPAPESGAVAPAPAAPTAGTKKRNASASIAATQGEADTTDADAVADDEDLADVDAEDGEQQEDEAEAEAEGSDAEEAEEEDGAEQAAQ